jgi:hypothetical protein
MPTFGVHSLGNPSTVPMRIGSRRLQEPAVTVFWSENDPVENPYSPEELAKRVTMPCTVQSLWGVLAHRGNPIGISLESPVWLKWAGSRTTKPGNKWLTKDPLPDEPSLAQIIELFWGQKAAKRWRTERDRRAIPGAIYRPSLTPKDPRCIPIYAQPATSSCLMAAHWNATGQDQIPASEAASRILYVSHLNRLIAPTGQVWRRIPGIHLHMVNNASIVDFLPYTGFLLDPAPVLVMGNANCFEERAAHAVALRVIDGRRFLIDAYGTGPGDVRSFEFPGWATIFEFLMPPYQLLSLGLVDPHSQPRTRKRSQRP